MKNDRPRPQRRIYSWSWQVAFEHDYRLLMIRSPADPDWWQVKRTVYAIPVE